MPREKKNLSSTSGGREEAKLKISQAAIRCFERYGPHRTSMADISEEAGISRKTLYRVFDDRPALIEYILLQRMYIISVKVKKNLEKYETFEESLVDGSIYSIQVCREDKLFNEIFKRDSNHRVELFLLGPSGQLKADMIELWSGTIAAGRAKNQIRDELTDERIVELLANINSLLLIREDYSYADQRRFLEDFLLPALRPMI